MDIHELSVLFDLKKQIVREVEALKGLRALLKRKPDTRGTISNCISDLQRSIEAKRRQYLKKRDEINAFLSGIEDGRIRLWTTLHYAEAMTWYEVKTVAGASNTPESIRMACERYLRSYGK